MDVDSVVPLCRFKAGHSIPVMLQRNITFQDVEQVLCNPNHIAPHRTTPRRWVYYENPNNQGLKVIVDLMNVNSPPEIVTTFRTQ